MSQISCDRMQRNDHRKELQQEGAKARRNGGTKARRSEGTKGDEGRSEDTKDRRHEVANPLNRVRVQEPWRHTPIRKLWEYPPPPGEPRDEWTEKS